MILLYSHFQVFSILESYVSLFLIKSKINKCAPLNQAKAVIVILAQFFLNSVSAQTIPDAGSLLESQKQQEQFRAIPRELLEMEPEVDRSSKLLSSDQKIQISAFKLTGNISVYSQAELLALIEDAIGQSFDLAGLEALANRITNHYRKAGYFLAKVYLPLQDVTEGVITFAVQEGTLDSNNNGVDIQGDNLRINKSLVIDLLFSNALLNESLTPGKPMDEKSLERAVLLLNDLPGITASANLEPGVDQGSTRIKLSLEEEPMLSFSSSADNSGSRYTGAERLTLSAVLKGLSGYGDQLTLSVNGSNNDNTYISVGYLSQVGSSGLKVGLNYSYLNYILGKDLKSLNAKGVAKSITLNATYPVYRSRIQSFYLNAAFDWKGYKDEANGVFTSKKTVDVATLGFNWERFDSGGLNQATIQVKMGELDLSGVASSVVFDQAITGPKRNGHYKKLSYSFSRLQKTNDKLSFYASLMGQVANKNLDSSERLQMSGPSGVRAYPVGEVSADEGYKFTLEGRYMIKRGTQFGDVQVSLFYDRANLNQFHTVGGQSLTTPNHFKISGWGIGADLTKSSEYNISLSWARKIGDNPLRAATTGLDADGTDDKSRFWLAVSLYF